jgi:adenine-specific DNA-methyltransferase
MIYPRLTLAKRLLSDDGLILISIDDAEQASLRRVCDQVFGEQNFVSQLVWEKASHYTQVPRPLNCNLSG